ncbi:HAD family hydrolase [Thermoactinomyces mirandus]|uniref:HAD family hydrolase n=1 Tax=Thermoactinomyces mirandus TaxID=2756294 RepID=A0A7W1XRF2_9BACL|nr:HAD family hydrolase [Thermoactinomyces mirandus]MBA4601874.1 HAD family hydrolase [Thermoactinomyces mirandus]
MIKACLFDLDGTLLPMDTMAFAKVYLNALASKVKHLISPQKLIKAIWQATEAVIRNDEEDLTNEQVFEREFIHLTGIRREEIWPYFDDFYAHEFPALSKYTQMSPLSRKVVETAILNGYKVVVATNPVFPEMAILERLRWAKIDDLPFEWITVYENSHFCKPNPRYYLSVAEKIGVHPEECVMIGNDMQEDMVASTVGMKTFFLTDYRIDLGKPVYPVDEEGSLQDLLAALENRTGPFKNE